ncbi:MAG: universal stress protein [Eggerthellaceae bacterium]
MKYQRILVPFDGSDHACSAFTTARSIAIASPDAEIFVVNVISMNVASSFSQAGDPSLDRTGFDQGYAAMVDDALRNITQEIEEVVEPLYDGLPAERVHIEAITYSSPVHGLVEYANDHSCDLIVMGRRGLSALRGMLGSVSYGILHNTDIPVLTVK